MDITKLSIKRPVALLMVVCIVILLGGVSLTNLPIDLMPSMNIPYAVVMTTYSGAGPYVVENMVTKPLESAVATVQNVKSVQSQSTEGTSFVIVEFSEGTDMDFASLDLREKLDMVKAMLPDGIGTPMVMKMDMNSMPIASLTINGNHMGQDDLKSFVEDKIEPRIERLDGIASVDLSGGREKEIKVTLDVDKITGMGLSVGQIVSALASENYNQSGGKVDYGDLSFSVRTQGEFVSVDQIAQMPLLMPTGGFVQLKDIAVVEETYKEDTSFARIDGQDCVILSLQKSTDSNIVAAMRNVKKELKRIEGDYPEVNFGLIDDQSEFIERAIANVVKNLVLGAVLAIVVLMIFLKNVGLTLVISMSIPISVIATFVLIYFSGTTLNIISLGGLALGVGMLVDNAIVVMENIYRHRVEGSDRIVAAYDGTQEVRSAVVASTLTTVVVFLPIAFTSGLVIQIFKDMALTVCFSLFSSLLVAITMVPMLCATIVRKMSVMHAPKSLDFFNKFIALWDRSINHLNDIYQKVLAWALRRRKRTLLIAIVTFLCAAMLIPFIGIEFIPTVDEGGIAIAVTMPEGTKLEETNQIIEEIEEIVSAIPEMETVSSSVGSAQTMMSADSKVGTVTCQLTPRDKRDRGTNFVADDIRNQLKHIPGAKIAVSLTGSMMGSAFGGGGGISYELQGPEFDKLTEISDHMVSLIQEVEGTREVTTSLSANRTEVQITVDRQKASTVGLTAAQVASGVRLALEGKVATTLKQDGTELDVRVAYPEEVRSNFEKLKSITVRTPTGGNIALSALADIELADGPTTIVRSNQQRLVTVSADVIGRDIGTVDGEIWQKLNAISLPDGYTLATGGQIEMLSDSVYSLMLMFIMAVILVYMVMAAQFESLLYPFVIMFSIPLAATGSLVLLFLTRTPLSTPALIGAVMLVGIVVNNAIVLVDYINKLRQRGLGIHEAIITAGPKRLRPILMTALTTILALLPMVFSSADGAEMQRPLAMMVMGGLVSSTMLTLIVVPVLYTYFDALAHRIKKFLHIKPRAKEEQT